ncbi:hypothetical protein GUJ93_ZPchr0012g19881 [Zizania palustris]|uniref:Uncharacterized protein n=1 Tax=Zizania palustris TaxID=103762 RepID=A0A8J5WXL2_ZIZPA|nr:hypothetical protein GUJ93_ZPchr0012g19881 [Zizania palustris]
MEVSERSELEVAVILGPMALEMVVVVSEPGALQNHKRGITFKVIAKEFRGDCYSSAKSLEALASPSRQAVVGTLFDTLCHQAEALFGENFSAVNHPALERSSSSRQSPIRREPSVPWTSEDLVRDDLVMQLGRYCPKDLTAMIEEALLQAFTLVHGTANSVDRQVALATETIESLRCQAFEAAQ